MIYVSTFFSVKIMYMAGDLMSMQAFHGKVTNSDDTPMGYTISIICATWKMLILYIRAENEKVRFNALKRMIGTITYKTLSTQLKELEANDIIIRTEYPQIPPKVEYSLSEKGKSLIPILETICEW